MRLAFLWLASGLTFLQAQAQPTVAAQTQTQTQAQIKAQASDARALFLRMQAAASKSNYQGTLVVSTGGVASSSRVAHYVVEGQVYEALEALDGRAHRVLRHNDAVHMLWPQTQLAVIEKRETLAAWSTTPQAVDAYALENYDLRQEGASRVAGRDAQVLWLQPRDGLRYAQRYWADQDTALMLRADVMALPATGAAVGAVGATLPAWLVVESSAFSAIELGVAAQPQLVLKAMSPPAGFRIVRPKQQLTTLESQGWALVRPVQGFRLAGSALRGMENAGQREPVLHTLFTDGVTLVSVFVESFNAAVHRSEGLSQQGATASLSHRRGEHWFTVVGAVPPGSLKLFAAALEKRAH